MIAGFFIKDLIIKDLISPAGDIFVVTDVELKEVGKDLEHSVDDVIDGKIGTKFFFIKIIEGFTLAFSPIRDVPGLEGFRRLTQDGGPVFLEV